MTQVISLFMVMSIMAGGYKAGIDLMDIMTKMAQVAVEKLTMNQIGKSIMLFNISAGRKLTFAELPDFLVKNITGGGSRDVRRDIWGTAYYLEIAAWRGTTLAHEDFVLCSPGPDTKWWSTDDELWSNFQIPDNLLFKARPTGAQHETGSAAMSKYLELQKSTAEALEKLKAMLGTGTTDITATTPDGPT